MLTKQYNGQVYCRHVARTKTLVWWATKNFQGTMASQVISKSKNESCFCNKILVKTKKKEKEKRSSYSKELLFSQNLAEDRKKQGLHKL